MFSEPIRAVSPRINPRCPECHCFVRLDAGTCSACGFVFAFSTRSLLVSPLSNLQPDGKIKKKKNCPVDSAQQLDLFSALEVC